MKISEKQKELLFGAWEYCDVEDKSTEFMFQYMSDTANVDYDDVVEFVIETPSSERAKYFKK